MNTSNNQAKNERVYEHDGVDGKKEKKKIKKTHHTIIRTVDKQITIRVYDFRERFFPSFSSVALIISFEC